ncbi:MAG: oligosaccharide flippase family protein [Acidobacteria bacterium]|nr:oligosaccharide flippase family protein [Acidobacteriota bacterium]
MLQAVAGSEPAVPAGQAQPLRDRAARAALAAGTGEIVTRLSALALSIVTARLLEPFEVGVLGIAVILIGLISINGYYPETAAVADSGSEKDAQYALCAFLVRSVVTIVLLIAALLVLPRAAVRLTGHERGVADLAALFQILVGVPLLQSLAAYPSVYMQRRLDLTSLAGIQVLQSVTFAGLAIALLLGGSRARGVAWSYVVSSAIVSVVFWQHVYRRGWVQWPGWPPVAMWRRVSAGSGKVFVGGFGGYLGERADNLLVAGAIGPAAMAFYSMGWNASRTIANVVARAISSVFVPTLPRIQQDAERVRRALHECLKHSYLLLTPACAILLVSAESLVIVVLGSKWLPTVPALRVMSVTVLTIPVIFVLASLLIGTGRAHLTGAATLSHLFSLAILMPWLSSRWAVVGAATGDLVATVVLTTVLCLIVTRGTRQVRWSLLAASLPALACVVPAAAIAWSIGHRFEPGVARLLIEGVTIVLTYPAVMWMVGGPAALQALASVLRGALRPGIASTAQYRTRCAR